MIKFIRSIIVIIMLILFGFGALFIRYFIFPFQKTRDENYKTLQKSWQIYIRMLEICKVLTLKVNDEEKIKNIKNSIIVSTHPSFVDIVILMSIIPNSTCFVAEKLSRNPFFKGMVKLLFILETSSTEDWLKDACEKLDNGLNIIIFPMGGRHKMDAQPKIRRGTALMALKSQKNIVALHLKNNFDFLQKGQPVYKVDEKPTEYTLDYIGEINSKDFLAKYPDEVTFKTEITKQITKTLYN